MFRDVIPRVLAAVPSSLFVFAGPDRGHRRDKNMESYIRGGLTPDANARVHFLGPQTWAKLRALYQKASVCVFPSRFETFGQVCVEAMASGSVVIGSRIGGMSEIISDGQDGHLIQPGDVAGLSKMIVACLRLPSDQLKKAARRRVERAFSLSAVAPQAVSIYQSVLDRRSTPRRS